MAATAKVKQIAEEVRAVLSNGVTIEGNALKITARLDQPLYTKVNEVLEAAGGKWNKKAQAHLFDGDPTDRLEGIILTGTFVRQGDLGFFPTPPEIVARLLERAQLGPGHRTLEPSAGRGAIAKAARDVVGANLYCVELQQKWCNVLQLEGFPVHQGDFLEFQDAEGFDRVVMNPPFAPNQLDIEHVRHAAGMLRPGGILVSVMAAGLNYRTNRKTTAFLEEFCPEVEDLPENAFQVSGTNVSTVLVTITK